MVKNRSIISDRNTNIYHDYTNTNATAPQLAKKYCLNERYIRTIVKNYKSLPDRDKQKLKEMHVLPDGSYQNMPVYMAPAIQEIVQVGPPRTPFKLLLDVGTGNTTFLLGSSKAGKTTAMMKIYDDYYAGGDFISILWSINTQIPLYKRHKNLLKASTWNRNSEDVIKEQKKIQTATNNKYKFLNIFDDIINVRHNDLFNNLITTYRNSQISTIVSLQYSNMMSKCSRANCNNILAFRFNTDEAIEVIIKTYLTGYLKKIGITNIGDQINWYKDMTSDHGFIYIKPADAVVSFHKFDI